MEGFYVRIHDWASTTGWAGLLAGPFSSEEAALARLGEVRRLIEPWWNRWFPRYTFEIRRICRTDGGPMPVGHLNPPCNPRK